MRKADEYRYEGYDYDRSGMGWGEDTQYRRHSYDYSNAQKNASRQREENPNSSSSSKDGFQWSHHLDALARLEANNSKSIETLQAENEELKRRIDELSSESNKYTQFLKTAEKTTNTIRCIAIGAAIVTFLLVLFFIYWYCQEDKFSPVINLIGGILGFVSFGELIYIPISIKKIESRIEELEKSRK